MSAHTPGPWHIWANTIVAPKHMNRPDGITPCIAEVWSHIEEIPEHKANARLIAAAPEMFELLKYIEEGIGFDSYPVQYIWRETMRLMKKIEGEKNDKQ